MYVHVYLYVHIGHTMLKGVHSRNYPSSKFHIAQKPSESSKKALMPLYFPAIQYAQKWRLLTWPSLMLTSGRVKVLHLMHIIVKSNDNQKCGKLIYIK